MSRVSAVVLCHNEAPNIRHCLESVTGWADVFVVDSGSTDETLAICAEYTANVVHHPYENHASQWNWALENLPLTTEWVLALDADFVVTPALRTQLERDLSSVPVGVDGIYVKHDYVFGGGAIRFGGTKQYWLRIIRRGSARPDLSDLVDFRFNVDATTIQWSGAVVEYNRHDDDITVWTRKQDKFSLRLAVEEELRRRNLVAWEGKPGLLGNPDQRFMRLRDLWLKLPLFLRPCIYFFYRYFLMLGFLDGRAGFLYAALQGFWLRLMVDWKIWRIRAASLSNDELIKLKTEMFTTRDGEVGALLKRVQSGKSENHAV